MQWWILGVGSPGLYAAVVLVPLVGILLIAALTQLPPRLRRPLISLLVFVSGMFYVLQYFIPPPRGETQNFLDPFVASFVDPFTQILGGLLIGQGLYSISRIHFRNVVRTRPGWINSLALLISAVAMTYVAMGALAFKKPDPHMENLFDHLFSGVYQQMAAAMFSLIAFYILSAAYRAFRIRSIESSILMISALVVVLGLSFGVLLTSMFPTAGILSNLRIENWGLWLLTVVSSPSLRAIDFGIGVGALAMALRLWLSIERGALFGD